MKVKKTFIPEIRSVPLIQEYVRGVLSKIEVTPKILLNIDLVIEEIVVNIVKHGLKDVKDGMIETAVNLNGDCLDLIFTDNGIPFNPLKKEDPDIKEDKVDKRDIGGLGIFLVKQLAKTIQYSRKNGCNSLNLQIELESSKV